MEDGSLQNSSTRDATHYLTGGGGGKQQGKKL